MPKVQGKFREDGGDLGVTKLDGGSEQTLHRFGRGVGLCCQKQKWR